MKLSRINSLLLVSIILVNGYTLLAPLVPELLYAQQKHVNPPHELERKLRPKSSGNTDTSTTENRLIIPSLGLNQQIYEGKTAKTLANGLWRRPFSSTPNKNGNTVISGHRFTYDNPSAALYHLNKVQLGDTIGVTWDGKTHRYKVTEIKTVKPDQTDIEAATTNSQLTIYTCTPLWLPKDRLVVIARLESETEVNHE